ncbi:MAG: TIGR03862 family flavoprotein [Gammaproteobacteria bacterium]|nr:TIGR03862 family flavoprotein [Gammaproteobacteria bacterium]
MTHSPTTIDSVAIIGGGPAGLMAAEVLLAHGIEVDLYDRMPSLARKLLIAGRGGLNLTHAEPFADFARRYQHRQPQLEPMIAQFDANALRHWCDQLGIATFVGSSQRVFPQDFKAAPLLRAWLHRLREQGLRIHVRHRWLGWDTNAALVFEHENQRSQVQHRATLLALGGGSWAKLGSDGQWVAVLQQQGITVEPLQPSNCGFETRWSEHFRQHYAGQPIKSVRLHCTAVDGQPWQHDGELMITEHGLEGGALYALSTPLRDRITQDGEATLLLDLLPARSGARLQQDLGKPRGKLSLARFLEKQCGLKGAKANLLREVLHGDQLNDMALLAKTIKALPLRLHATRPLDEAISSAGGVPFEALTPQLMLKQHPGVFLAGEMLDWEAPTGGYLLTACFATGRWAAQGILDWLAETA